MFSNNRLSRIRARVKRQLTGLLSENPQDLQICSALGISPHRMACQLLDRWADLLRQEFGGAA